MRTRLPVFGLACNVADHILSNLPSDITFEICTSPIGRSHEDTSTTLSETSAGNFVKSERVVGGMHFLSEQEEDRAELLVPKSEAGDNEPEVRKQVRYCALYFHGELGSEGNLFFRGI